MANTYTEYTQGENGNFYNAFQITFPFLSPADLKVTVNGVPTAASVTNSVAVIDPIPETDDVIRITRDTDIESARSVFVDPSALLASDLNRNVDQAIYKLQELETTIETLTTSAPGGAGMPTATANNLFLVSGSNGSGGWSWFQKTTGEVTSLLGVGANAVPTPVPGWRFMLTHQTNATYILSTVAEVKALLGVNATIPAISGLANHFMTSNVGGTGYELSNASTARSKLGLGSAATLNTGTGVGNVPVLVSGTGSAALPAVSGENLTNVNKTIDYAMWQRVARVRLPKAKAGTYPNSDRETGSAIHARWVNITSCPAGSMTTDGAAGDATHDHLGGCVEIPTGGSSLIQQAVSPATAGWVSLDTTNGSDRMRLSPGTYYIKAQGMFWADDTDGSAVPLLMRFVTWAESGGTISPSSASALTGLPFTVQNQLSAVYSSGLTPGTTVGDTTVGELETVLRVTGNTGYFTVDATRIGNQGRTANVFAGTVYFPSVRIHVWKLA